MKFYYNIVVQQNDSAFKDYGTHLVYGPELVNVTGAVEAENEELAKDMVIDEHGIPEYWEEFYEYQAV